MKPGPAVPLLGYALVIGAAAAILAVWTSDPLPPALLGGSAGLMAVIAAAVAVYARRAGAVAGGPAVRPVPDYSFPVVAVALALCTMLVGAYLGLYLILIGGGLLVLGLGGLAREARAQRRALRRATQAAAAEGAGDAG